MRDETAERYLLGQLSETERVAYEQHYFACSQCFAELSRLHAVGEVLRELPPLLDAVPMNARPRPRRAWTWPAVAALAASIVGLALILRPRDLPEQHARAPIGSTGPTAEAPPAASVPSRPPIASAPAEPSARLVEESTSPPRVVDESRQIAAAMKRLASISPPSYQPMVLRGPTDEATVMFRKGMAAYIAGDYGAAVTQLEHAAVLYPERPDIAFFLGVSQLLTGDTAGAIRDLQRTVVMGETPFLADAHFYLAKAHLAGGDARSARTNLEAAVRLTGDTQRDAAEALAEMDRLRLR